LIFFRGPDTIIFSFRRSLLRSFPNIFTKNTPMHFFLCLSVCHILNLVYLAYIHVCPSVTDSKSSCFSCLSVYHKLIMAYLAYCNRCKISSGLINNLEFYFFNRSVLKHIKRRLFCVSYVFLCIFIVMCF
jgi:hypothetical protein